MKGITKLKCKECGKDFIRNYHMDKKQIKKAPYCPKCRLLYPNMGMKGYRKPVNTSVIDKYYR